MTTRRGFLAGLMAAGMAPRASWADAGSPAYLNAARTAMGDYQLIGLSASGTVLFRIPLPTRGHAAAAHPSRPEAVGFARRPGTYAMVIDCVGGTVEHRFNAPEGRHFYGHGAFSADGALLFTAENDYDAARGVIGIWDVAAGYRRLGEFASHGVGPHDVKLMPDRQSLVIANGGIETHPESGRAKLNIPMMRPNLSYVSLDGALLEQVELAPEMHKNSIRHLDLLADGGVAFAMQWQGDVAAAPALLGLHRRGGHARLFRADAAAHRHMQGYAGSVAFDAGGSRVAITSPRGGLVQVFDVESGAVSLHEQADVCGIAPGPDGFIVTAGTGALGPLDRAAQGPRGLAWDNHLVRLGMSPA